MTDYDPRIVDLYDEDNPDGPDHDFYRSAAEEMEACSIVDLGCGTGILTVTLSRPGRTVVGIDPSAAMIAFAARRPGGEGVRWIQGDSALVEPESADLIVMTGNVAQHILGAAWPSALRDAFHGLRPEGRLVFESRNPSTCAWEDWAGEVRSTRLTTLGRTTEWMDVQPMSEGGCVSLAAHTVFESSGEHVIQEETLAFRSRTEVESGLSAAGFEVENVWGGWHRQPLSDADPIMVFQARRPN